MTPTKLLIGQILIVFAIVIAGVWFATQWCAAELGFQARLGAPWFELLGIPVYYPWRLFEWWYAYDAYAPELFNRAGAVAASSGFMGCAVAIVGSLWRARQSRMVTTYGSSRWATKREVEAAGLFRTAGVLLGRLGSRYLRHDEPEHVLAFAPTRSDKGVGLVIPTLLSWTGSAVIHDIKGENCRLTAGWRAKFSHSLLFNPTDPRSARYNPLLEVRKGPDEVRDVQNIADILVDPEGALERRSHWEKTSHALLVGAILHVLYAEQEKTLARVATFLSDPQRSFAHTLRRMMGTNHLGTPEHPRVHPVVASAAREVLNKSENERSGVLSTAMSFLGLYRDPTVAATTDACDWRITDLVDAERPLSLYLVIPPSDISRTKALVRLVLNQIGRRLTERLEGDPGKRPRHEPLMMLDEFPALGRLDFFETALAFMAGYGIRAYLIAQSLNQIFQGLRREQRHPRQLPRPHRLQQQRRADGEPHLRCAWHGDRIARAAQLCRPSAVTLAVACHGLAPGDGAAAADAGRVMQLPPADELVLVSGLAPIRAKKLRYYRDRNFTTRVVSAPVLAEDGYRDRSAPRHDDWGGQVRGPGRRLTDALDAEARAGQPEEGGLQRQRHPGLPEKDVAKPHPERAVGLGLDNGPTPPADAQVMDRSRGLGATGRAHAINEGEPQRDPGHDLLPEF
jgi:type IV secretion system protein VirD4